MTSNRDAALKYALAGFRVLPLIANGKTPNGRFAPHGVKDATTNPQTIMDWWNAAPDGNIGIATGNGIVVLDIDVKNGKDGRLAIANKDLTGAFHVVTPSGGHHYYFKTASPFRNGANVYGMTGVDVRGDNGYVVAPPSQIDGKRYATSDELSSIGDVPQWLIDEEAKRNAPPSGGEVSPTDYDQDLLNRARAYIQKFAPAISGQGGHIQTLKAASALVVGFQLSDEDALNILCGDFNPRCIPPWSVRELRHKVEEARKKPIREIGYLLNRVRSRATKDPITNYTVETETKDGKTRDILVPKPLSEICDEILQRYNEYPRRLGERLFDFNPTTEKPETINNPMAFSAWLQREGECLVDFRSKPAFPKIQEVFECFMSTAKTYSAVVSAPYFPQRSDVFDLCGELPPPEKEPTAFWTLVNCFSLATDMDRLSTAMYLIAPIFFSELQDFDRPMWVIDSVDAQGSGKTTVAEVCACLYDCTPIMLDFSTLDRLQDQAKKRLISSEGRASRFVLFDNVVGDIKSPTLANLITSKRITERAAYGRGEESRPNDLTYTLTVNGGEFDADLASRSYTIRVKKPAKMEAFWKRKTLLYTIQNRKQILADIIQMLKDNADRRAREGLWQRPDSRFKEFDSVVMAAVCKDREEFDRLSEHLTRVMTGANIDIDTAETFQYALEGCLKEAWDWTPDLPTIIYAQDITAHILSKPDFRDKKLRDKDVRQWIKAGMLPRFSKEFTKLSNGDSEDRRVAFLFGIDKFSANYTTEVQVIYFADNGGISKPTVKKKVAMTAKN